MYIKRFLSVLLSLCLLTTLLTPMAAFSDNLEYALSEPSAIVSLSGCSFTSEGGVITVNSSSAGKLTDYGIKYTVTETIPAGHVVLLHFGAASIGSAGNITAQVKNSSGTVLGVYTYPLVTQWNDVYMPVDIGSSNASNVVINFYTGGSDVKIDSVTLTDYGKTTVADLVAVNDGTLAIKSGMWMRGQGTDWTLNEIPYTQRLNSEITNSVDIISDENYLYALDASDKKLQILDIDTGDIIGTSENLTSVRQIAWVDANTVFVTSREGAAWIIDVTNRAKPTVLSHYDSVEMATGIDVSGNIAAVTNRTYGVEIVDIKDRTKPVQLSIIKCGEAQSCRISGKYLFAGVWGEGIVKIYNIEDPSNPKKVSELNLLGKGDGLEVHGNYVYCATGQHARKYGSDDDMESKDHGKPGYAFGNGMEIWDITNIAAPVRCSVTRTDGKLYVGNHDTWDVTLGSSGGSLYAYLNDAYQGIYAYNVDDPCNPIRVAHITVKREDSSSILTSSSKVYVVPYDQTKYAQLPVDGSTIQNGSLYFVSAGGGVHKFTADYVGSQITTDHTGVFTATESSAYATDLATLKRLFDTNTRKVLSYHRGYQIYAALEKNGYVYVAEGLAGLTVLKKDDFSIVQNIPTGDITYDVKIYNHTLYTANGTDGLISYTINPDGTLTATGNVYKCVSGGRVRTMKHMLLSPKANFAVLHVDDADLDIVDLRTYTRSSVVPGGTPMRTSGLMYYRQITPQLINNRYAAAWGQASNIYVIDFGENDDGPVITRNLDENTINFNCGMTQNIFPVPDGRTAGVVQGKGYTLFDINDLSKTKVYDSSKDTLYSVSNIVGKGIYLDGVGVVTDRINGSCHIVDMTKLEKPVLLSTFTLASNPDIASASDDTLYIPAGYEGLYSIPLDNIKGRMLGKDVIPQGATVLMNEDFEDTLDTNVWMHSSPGTDGKTAPSGSISNGKLRLVSGTDEIRQTGSYGLFNKKVPLKSGVDTSDGTYITDVRANATLTVIYSMDLSAYEGLSKNRVVYSGLHNSSAITPSSKTGGASNVVAGSVYYNSLNKQASGYENMSYFEYGDYTQYNSKTNSPDVVDDSYFDAASSRFKIVIKITDKYGNYYDTPKVSMYYQSANAYNWVSKEVVDLPALTASDYVDCLYFMSNTNPVQLLVDDVIAYYTDNEAGEEPVYPDIVPVESNDLINDYFDSTLDQSVWGYSYMDSPTTLPAGGTRTEYTGATAKLENGAFYMKAKDAQSTSSYVGGFYGKMNKKVPLTSSYTDDGSYMTDFSKNTKLVATFKLDTKKLATSSERYVYLGFQNSSKLNNATASSIDSAPYGRKGVIGAQYTYKDNSASNKLNLYCLGSTPGNSIFVTGEALGNVSYYKLELTLTDENGTVLNNPKYTVSYRTSESDPWMVSPSYEISSSNASNLGYIDCLYFHFTGSGSYIYLDDVNVYLTYDYSTGYQGGIASFYTPQDSDCFAIVAAYGSDHSFKGAISNDEPLIRGVNKISLKDLDTDEAEYIKVMLWKDRTSIEPLCVPTISYLD